MDIKIKRIIITLLLTLLAIGFLFPLALTISNSFMSEQEISDNYDMVTSKSFAGYKDNTISKHVKLNLIPNEAVLKQYYTVLIEKSQFLLMFWNSVKLVVPIVFGQVIVAAMAAYAFAKLRFKYRDILFFVYIIVMLMPFQVTLVQNYLVADKLNLLNTHLSIILPGIFNTFGVFLLKQFMENIPDSYIEAAKMDGASEFDIVIKLIIPLCKGGIAAAAILIFIDNWNMVEQPLILLKDAVKLPLSIYLSQITEGEKGVSFAASTLYMIPMLLIFLNGENYLVEGIQLSGIKG